jgi:cytochrome P450
MPGRNAPPAARRPYDPGSDVLAWMGQQFDELGDIFQATIYGTSAYIVRDPTLAEHVLRANWQSYSKGQAAKRIGLLLGNGLMVSEGELWKRQRRLIQPAFGKPFVASLTALMSSASAEVLERWKDAARRKMPVDVTADVSALALTVVLRSIFGNDIDRVRPTLSMLSEHGVRDLDFAEAFRESGRLIAEIARARRQEERAAPDILGLLLQARDGETGCAMSDRQLVNEVKTLIVAGHETTASTLNWLWYLLSQHRPIDDRLTEEISRLSRVDACAVDGLAHFTFARQVLEETMRLYPAGWLLTRRALADDRLGDYFVPAKTEVHIPLYFIQRHPALWDNPDQFLPDRFATAPERHKLATMPFSAGPRNCIGEFLARTEMQIHLVMVARQLRFRYLAASPPEFDVGINLRSKDHIVMAAELKQAAS